MHVNLNMLPLVFKLVTYDNHKSQFQWLSTCCVSDQPWVIQYTFYLEPFTVYAIDYSKSIANTEEKNVVSNKLWTTLSGDFDEVHK